MKINLYHDASDYIAVTNMVVDSIHQIGSQYYSAAQLQAWAAIPIDYQHWRQHFNAVPPYVARIEQQVVAIMSLEDDGHIQWAYTAANVQRQGIASQLLMYVEQQARKRTIDLLYTEASVVAQPFFSQHGFKTLQRNQVERHGQRLTNFSMQKSL